LAERRDIEIVPQVLDEIKANRQKDYAGAALRGQHMQLGFLQHSLMISRFHFMLEAASRCSVSFREGCVGFQWAACVAGFTRMNSTSHWMCLPEAVGRPPGKI